MLLVDIIKVGANFKSENIKIIMTTKYLSIFLIALTLVSCNQEEKEDAIINYYFTSTNDTTFESISFQFSSARAHRQQNTEIRTVYLEPTKLDFNLSSPQEVFLGSSTIEPEKIEGFDFGLEGFTVIKETDTIELVQQFNTVYYASLPLEPSEGEIINLTISLNIDASIVLDSAGQNWILPKVEIDN